MGRGEQHAGNGQDLAHATLHQRSQTFADDRPGEFEIAGLDRVLGQPGADAGGDQLEFLHGAVVAAAVAADHDPGRLLAVFRGQDLRKLTHAPAILQ